ncbi:MAG: hypothetical protein ABIL58_23215 [Pseudomonadota bacterium]
MVSIEKQPWEAFFVAGDFAAELATGETLDDGETGTEGNHITAMDNAGNDVSDTFLDQDTLSIGVSTLTIRCRGGSEAASPYKIDFRCVTTDANKYEVEMRVKVRDR